VLAEIDTDELEVAIEARMETIKRADDFHESADGPDDETKYILHEDGLPSGGNCDLQTHSVGTTRSTASESFEASHSR
jgi:hypothetical protein